MTQGIKRMAKAELGTKRTCLSCNMRFYDFNRRPIICPGCGAEFKAVNLIKSQTVRKKPEEETKSDESAVEVNIDDDTDVDMDFEEDDIDDKEGPGVIQDEISADDELLPKLHQNDD